MRAIVGTERMEEVGERGNGCRVFALEFEEGRRKGSGNAGTGGGGVPC